MPQVNLPPGCRSLQMQDGKRYVAAREGGKVTVSAEHAKAIDAVPGNGTAGLVSAGFREYAAPAAKGKFCPKCAFHAYAFTAVCPRCRTELPSGRVADRAGEDGAAVVATTAPADARG